MRCIWQTCCNAAQKVDRIDVITDVQSLLSKLRKRSLSGRVLYMETYSTPNEEPPSTRLIKEFQSIPSTSISTSTCIEPPVTTHYQVTANDILAASISMSNVMN